MTLLNSQIVPGFPDKW